MSNLNPDKFLLLELDGPAQRKPTATHCAVWTASAWASGTVQIEVATPAEKEAGIWTPLAELLFSENSVAEFPGDLWARAVNSGAPTDVQIELFDGGL